MQIAIAKAKFRPVTIVLETQDELDQLLAVIADVADNRITHLSSVVAAANALHDDITKTVETLQGA